MLRPSIGFSGGSSLANRRTTAPARSRISSVTRVWEGSFSQESRMGAAGGVGAAGGGGGGGGAGGGGGGGGGCGGFCFPPHPGGGGRPEEHHGLRRGGR